jgi:hypothetical protein
MFSPRTVSTAAEPKLMSQTCLDLQGHPRYVSIHRFDKERAAFTGLCRRQPESLCSHADCRERLVEIDTVRGNSRIFGGDIP